MSEENSHKNINGFSITLALIPIIIIFGLLVSVQSNGTDGYDDNPSIEDEEFLKDNYGGTEYYP